MPQPFLHLGDIGVVVQRVGRGRGAKRMRANLETQPECVPPHELVDPVGGNGIVEPAGAVVADRTEEGALGVGRMARLVKIVIEEGLGAGMQGDVPRLAALAMDPKVRNTAPRVDVLDLQLAELLPAEPVVKQGCEQGPVPEAFEAFFCLADS
jgi:hypothetical protein